jgi:toxin ParE1/3/4
VRPAVHYTIEAENDLDRIATYTLEVWGPEQRDAYLTVLEETCETIIPRHLRLARATPERPGILRWRVERHLVYFREVDDGIEIVRILHERMLPSRHS